MATSKTVITIAKDAVAKGRRIRVRLDVLHEDKQQMRRTYDPEHICNLATSIKEFGLRNAPEVEEITPGKSYKIIAGHCRVRACKLVPLKMITVRAHRKLTREAFIAIQIVENIHQQVPPHEAAEKYYEFYNVVTEKYGKVGLAKVASMLGRSESVLRDAFKFVRLNERVKRYIQDGKLPYGAGVLLSELDDATVQNELAVHAIITHAKVLVTDIKRLVDSHIESKTQSSLDALFYGSQEEAERQRKLAMKFFVDRLASRQALTAIGYFENLIYLHELNEGTLYDPLANRSVRQHIYRLKEALIKLETCMLPYSVLDRMHAADEGKEGTRERGSLFTLAFQH